MGYNIHDDFKITRIKNYIWRKVAKNSWVEGRNSVNAEKTAEYQMK